MIIVNSELTEIEFRPVHTTNRLITSAMLHVSTFIFIIDLRLNDADGMLWPHRFANHIVGK